MGRGSGREGGRRWGGRRLRRIERGGSDGCSARVTDPAVPCGRGRPRGGEGAGKGRERGRARRAGNGACVAPPRPPRQEALHARAAGRARYPREKRRGWGGGGSLKRQSLCAGVDGAVAPTQLDYAAFAVRSLFVYYYYLHY